MTAKSIGSSRGVDPRATDFFGVMDGRKAGTARAIPARSSLGGDLEGVTVLLRLVQPREPRRPQGGG